MKNRRVLVVDDDQDINECIRELLVDEGFEVDGAQHGQEALQLLRTMQELPCIVFVDIIMPVMDGPELIAQIRMDEKLRHLRLCAMSASPVFLDDVNADHRVSKDNASAIAEVALMHC